MTDSHTQRLSAALTDRYRIERELGEGGMATVYLAQDVRHNRQVAVKVLKPELAAVVGAERFLTEIETTANLQHPHILPLFDSGEADGFLFYVMPYIDGETLGDRIAREKQLPVDEALGIATSVCNALQVAHDAGIVHRDIKPGNILLSRGEPLVADFGIALAVGAGGSRLTETGLSVGTPYYMSPEQATGDQSIGPSADIYALACVLYEMLVGEPPYLGNTAQAVLGKIIQGDPVSATASRKTVPANVDAAIRKALEKLPADRFTRAADFGSALSDSSFRHGPGAVGSDDRGGAGRWRALAFAATALAAVTLVAAATGRLGSDGSSAPVQRQKLEFPALGPAYPWGTGIALAPDGSGMIYADRTDARQVALFYKARGDEDGTYLPGTEDARDPTFSPDGEWVAFRHNRLLVKRPVRGGAPVTLAEDVDGGSSAIHWMKDGTILFELDEGDRLARISEDGGSAVDTLANVGTMRWLQGIEGADFALVVSCSGGCRLGLADFATREVEYILDGVDRAWYLESGHIVYVRDDGAVFAAPFDVDARQLGALGVPLFQGVRTQMGNASMVLGDDGTMVYVRGGTQGGGGDHEYLVWTDRSGDFEPVDSDWAPDDLGGAFLSPDGTRIAVGVFGDLPEIWVKELPAGPLTRISDPGYGSMIPVEWTSDGRSLVYGRFRGDVTEIVRIRADGSQAEAEVLFTTTVAIGQPSLTPSDDEFVYTIMTRPRDVAFASGTSDSITLVLDREYDETAPTLSPDGRWLAYVSDVTGAREVFVRPFPEVEHSRIQVSVGGGSEPLWSRDGTELFYKSGGRLVAAAVRADPDLQVTARTALFEVGEDYIARNGSRSYDVSLDGRSFLMARNVEAAGPQEADTPDATLILVQNWFTEVEAILGGSR
jgi:serine/threonine-protein kinase